MTCVKGTSESRYRTSVVRFGSVPDSMPVWPSIGERVWHWDSGELGTVTNRGLRLGKGGRETDIALVKWDNGQCYWLSIWKINGA